MDQFILELYLFNEDYVICRHMRLFLLSFVIIILENVFFFLCIISTITYQVLILQCVKMSLPFNNTVYILFINNGKDCV